MFGCPAKGISRLGVKILPGRVGWVPGWQYKCSFAIHKFCCDRLHLFCRQTFSVQHDSDRIAFEFFVREYICRDIATFHACLPGLIVLTHDEPLLLLHEPSRRPIQIGEDGPASAAISMHSRAVGLHILLQMFQPINHFIGQTSCARNVHRIAACGIRY